MRLLTSMVAMYCSPITAPTLVIVPLGLGSFRKYLYILSSLSSSSFLALPCRVIASSASAHIKITPEGADSGVDLDLQLTGVGIKSPSFTGSFSSLRLTGYVRVDPATNKLIVSLVASTSVVDIIRSLLGF